MAMREKNILVSATGIGKKMGRVDNQAFFRDKQATIILKSLQIRYVTEYGIYFPKIEANYL